jgi:hypothetical protein
LAEKLDWKGLKQQCCENKNLMKVIQATNQLVATP